MTYLKLILIERDVALSPGHSPSVLMKYYVCIIDKLGVAGAKALEMDTMAVSIAMNCITVYSEYTSRER